MEDVIDKAKDTMEMIQKKHQIHGKMTKFQKQSKLKAGYIERDEFKNSNLQERIFLL